MNKNIVSYMKISNTKILRARLMQLTVHTKISFCAAALAWQ